MGFLERDEREMQYLQYPKNEGANLIRLTPCYISDFQWCRRRDLNQAAIIINNVLIFHAFPLISAS